MKKWEAMLLYDDGRIGRVSCFGLKSREEAIAWLERAFDWRRCWYLKPSCWIKEM